MVPGLHYNGPKDHLISSRPLKMVREGPTYLSIISQILKKHKTAPRDKMGRDETRRDERFVSV